MAGENAKTPDCRLCFNAVGVLDVLASGMTLVSDEAPEPASAP